MVTINTITIDKVVPMPFAYQPPKRTFNGIIALAATMVCQAFDCSLEELIGPGRSNKCAYPRMAFVYLVRNNSSKTWQEIAKQLNRHHSSAIYLYERAQDFISTKEETGDIIKKLNYQITLAL